jgi:hypothetical protein
MAKMERIEAVLVIEGQGPAFLFFHSRSRRAVDIWIAQERTRKSFSTWKLTLEASFGSGQHGMLDLLAYVDGGSLGNLGPSGIGVVIDGSTQARSRSRTGSRLRLRDEARQI